MLKCQLINRMAMSIGHGEAKDFCAQWNAMNYIPEPERSKCPLRANRYRIRRSGSRLFCPVRDN